MDFVVAIQVLRKSDVVIVRTSLIGSILSNLLMVLRRLPGRRRHAR